MIDDNLREVIVVIGTIVTPIVVYVIGKQAKRGADRAAVAAVAVKDTLEISDQTTANKLDEIHNLDKSIHVLVDGRLTEALDKIDRLEKVLYNRPIP